MARRTSTKKARTPTKAKASPPAVSKIEDEKIENSDETVAEATLVNELRKKEFVEKVAEACGQKKGVTKKVIDAALRELGDAVGRGDAINLPPLGKLMVNREKDVGSANIYITKLRRSKSMLADKAPKTEGEEASAEGEATTDA